MVNVKVYTVLITGLLKTIEINKLKKYLYDFISQDLLQQSAQSRRRVSLC